jgi:hypothetical protein
MNGWERAAELPLDDRDLQILDDIRGLFSTLDPPPPDLVERVQFALDLEDVEIEVFQLAMDRLDSLVTTRGEPSRTITFDSDSMSIMIRVSPGQQDRVRIDGWLAPPGERRIELRVSGSSRQTDADDQGRFAFEHVQHGLIQLAVHLVDSAAPGRRRLVLTPSVEV